MTQPLGTAASRNTGLSAQPSRTMHRLRRLVGGVLLLLTGALAQGALAACGPDAAGATCDGAGPASQGNTGGTNVGAGNPINVASGNKYQREVDLPALPGVLGLELVRHYNSVRSAPGAANGILGRGWSLSYETRLVAIGNTVQILEADGGRIIFNRDPRNPSACASADPLDGRMRIRQTPQGPAYVWTWTRGAAAGRQLSFDAQGNLVQIQAPTGEFVSLRFDGSGHLLEVTDPQGRSLRLNYLDRSRPDSARRFAGVQSIDTPVGRFVYHYGSPPTAHDTPAATVTAANLVQVDLPTHYDPQPVYTGAGRGASTSSISRVYLYEDARWPTLLTGISVRGQGSDGQLVDQRVSTYGYDDQARAVLSVRGRPAQTTADGRPAPGTGQAQVAVRYLSTPVPGKPGQVQITNSLGQTTTDTIAVIAEQFRLLETRGAPCSGCAPPNTRYTYDAAGRLVAESRLDAQGRPVQTLQRTLDTRGRRIALWQIDSVDGRALPPRLLERRVYVGEGDWPVRIARPSVVPGKEAVVEIAYARFALPGRALEDGPLLPTRITQTGYSPLDALGRPLDLHDPAQAARATPLSRTTSYAYATVNARVLLSTVDGPLPNGPRNDPADSDVTRFSYDSSGNRVVGIVRPAGMSDTLAYDQAGRVEAVTGADGIVTRYTHDAQGKPTQVWRAPPGSDAANGMQFAYDALGQLTQVASLVGTSVTPQSRLAYDGAGRLLWQASAMGILREAAYDTEGNVLSSTVRDGMQTQRETYGYDAFGRLVAVTDGPGITYRLAYNADGNVQTVTDPMGRVNRFDWDSQLQPKSMTLAANTDLAKTVSSTFDPTAGDQSIIIGPSSDTPGAQATRARVLRNDFGDVVATMSPERGTTVNAFDDAGRLVATTNAIGQTVRLTYDAAGRPLRRVVPGSAAEPAQVTTYTYAGTFLVAVDDPAQTTRYTHDAFGRITNRSVVLHVPDAAQVAATTRYTYGPNGQLLSQTLPDGSTLRFVRNGQGQVVGLERQDGRFGSKQMLVADLQRDLIGLSHLTYGNGIQARWQRSANGVLARIVYSRPGTTRQAGSQTASALDTLLDHLIADAHAAGDLPTPSRLPGAYGLPGSPDDLWDARYLYDVAGNMLAAQHQGSLVPGPMQMRYGYDVLDELISAQYGTGRVFSSPVHAKPLQAQEPGQARAWRYLLDGNADRLAAQQDVPHAALAPTERTAYANGSQRLQGVPYDAAGRPATVRSMHAEWNPLGQLLRLRRGPQRLAQYVYNAQGERVSKTVGPRQAASSTLYLYNDARQRIAEFDARGRILRQYVWLGTRLIAVLDSPEGVTPGQAANPDGVLQTAQTLVREVWSGVRQRVGAHRIRVAYILSNHLGAPIAATDDQTRVIWRAQYSPYGRRLDAALAPEAPEGGLLRTSMAATDQGKAFDLALRLPGQWEDGESGLHLNDARYYDPDTGRYLTPDPLGLAGGLNAYAYVAANPVAWVDPRGLLLMAFDGTGNGDPTADQSLYTGLLPGSSPSNVYKFYDAYAYAPDDPRYYITGIGTTNKDMTYLGNMASGDGFLERVDLATANLNNFISGKYYAGHNALINLDVVGFSRGAAEARQWVNQILAKTQNGLYAFTQNGSDYTACLNFRFEGLFDTVPHLGLTNGGDSGLNLSIPSQVRYAVQAVALNENRGGAANFEAYSIMPAPGAANSTAAGATRIEQGFVGSHSDIGGGYGQPGNTQGTPNGDLSNVAFTWMYEQAVAAGVTKLKPNDYTTVNSPILHDMVGTSSHYPAVFPTRWVHYVDNSGKTTAKVREDQINVNGTTQAWTEQFITRNHRQQCTRTARGTVVCTPTRPCPNDNEIIGMVDMSTYGPWLQSIGVNVRSTNPSPTQQMCH